MSENDWTIRHRGSRSDYRGHEVSFRAATSAGRPATALFRLSDIEVVRMGWASLEGEQILAAVAMAGLGLFAEGLRLGVRPADMKWDFTAEHHRTLLAASLGNADCRWQRWIDGDEYCSASGPGDPDLLSADGPTYLAPTTGHICGSCDMPKGALRCSALTHPLVTTIEASRSKQRALVTAQCSKGMPEVGDPSQCQPGGHSCWRFHPLEVATPVAPPLVGERKVLSLPEALDRLNTAWRTRFGSGLLKELPLLLTSRLAAPVGNLDGFVSRINALVTALEFRIDKKHVPESARDMGGVKKLRAVLESMGLEVPETPFQALGAAIACRSAGEHVHRSDEMTSALEYFGLRSITDDPQQAWTTISQACSEALAELADLLSRGA